MFLILLFCFFCVFVLQLGTLVPIATPAPPTTMAPPVRVDIQSSNLLNNLPTLLNTPTVSTESSLGIGNLEISSQKEKMGNIFALILY